jgi:hypothetical protein
VRSLIPLWSRIDHFKEEIKTRKAWATSAASKQLKSKQESLWDLRALVQRAMKMFDVPCTYRDLVRQWEHLHRCFAESWAWLSWQELSSTPDLSFSAERRI